MQYLHLELQVEDNEAFSRCVRWVWGGRSRVAGTGVLQSVAQFCVRERQANHELSAKNHKLYNSQEEIQLLREESVSSGYIFDGEWKPGGT